MKLSTILFIPDTHAPYHDERAWGVMSRVARYIRPDVLVILGDFADCYSVSTHDKDPTRLTSLSAELTVVNGLLDELDDIGVKRKIYLEGNHEYRLARLLASDCPALASLECLSFPRLLRLRERGWTWSSYRKTYRLGKLNLTHDIGPSGITALHRTAAAYESNVVIGHTHRMGTHYFGNQLGETHVAASFGWLGDASKVDYMHGTSVDRGWQLGFGIGHQTPKGITHLQAIPIIGGSCVVEGRYFKA
jgi:predicted phosphodiesterase